MYNALLAVQYIGIIAIFFESWLVFKSWKDQLRAYLFLSCLATLINNLGYLMEMKAKTVDAYITALQLSYSGRIWVAFAMLMFTLELCSIRPHRLIIRGLVLIHIAIYAVILTIPHNGLYYYNISFSAGNGFPVFNRENGVVHLFLMLLQGVYIILSLTALFISYCREKKRVRKRRMLMVIFAILVESLFYVMQMFSPYRFYDFTMIGSVLGTVFIFVSIFRYNLLGTKDIARDFMVDRLSEGVIAVDNDGDVEYYNEPAKALFPDIVKDPDSVIEAVRGAILHGNTIDRNGRIYSPEANDLLYKGESLGKLYVLIDSTEHFRRLHKEKKLLTKELLTDPLTGFYNRKGMENYLNKLYENVLNEGKYLFVCVADMNGLKYINDNFGHESGDMALRELAKMIKSSLGEGDMAFRTGGDEFLLLGVRDHENGQEKEISDRIEDCIRRFNENSSLPYKIDMSYGPLVKKLTGEEGELDRLIKTSDSMMYEMKKNRDSHRRS